MNLNHLHRFLIELDGCATYHWFKGKTRAAAETRAKEFCDLIWIKPYETANLLPS